MDAFDTVSLKSQSSQLKETPEKIYELIKKNEIGIDVTFLGPFGQRKCKWKYWLCDRMIHVAHPSRDCASTGPQLYHIVSQSYFK